MTFYEINSRENLLNYTGGTKEELSPLKYLVRLLKIKYLCFTWITKYIHIYINIY